jgi:hypothetical protein
VRTELKGMSTIIALAVKVLPPLFKVANEAESMAIGKKSDVVRNDGVKCCIAENVLASQDMLSIRPGI